MPTAEAIKPDRVGPATEEAIASDVDSLLSQADCLLDDVQANVAGDQAAEAPAEALATPSPISDNAASTAIDEAIHDMAAEITAPTDTADADATAALLNSNGPEEEPAKPESPEPPNPPPPASSDSAEPEVKVEPQVSAVPEPVQSPQPAQSPAEPAPAEWMAENPNDQVPDIPEAQDSTSAGGQEANPAAPTRLPVRQRSGTLRSVARGFARLPLDILILLDRPFARLGPGTKSAIGVLAIGTLALAAATWIYGNLHHAS